MRKATILLAVLFLTALYNTTAVLAQSSGSFSASFSAMDNSPSTTPFNPDSFLDGPPPHLFSLKAAVITPLMRGDLATGMNYQAQGIDPSGPKALPFPEA
jgi:hypothetical protein